MSLKKKVKIPLGDILELEKDLAPENLFSEIAAHASRDKIEYTGRGEKKIEAVFESLSRKNLKIVRFRISQWNNLKDNLDDAIQKTNQHLAYLIRKEKKRAEFKKRVAAIGTGKYTPSAEDSTEEGDDYGEEDRVASANMLNASFHKGINKKSGRLKTTEVKSASKKLKVRVDGFDDDLYRTDKFDFDIKQKTTFDRLSVSTKEALSLYTYKSSMGRAGKQDLKTFVNEVGLISFGTLEEFISFKLPPKWKPKKSLKWIKEKTKQEAVNHDRTFTYVELFVEAHRYKKGAPPPEVQVSKKYISPNMIVIFEPGGGIKRYQTFTNIKKLRLRKSDVMGGNVHYKFLNYTVQGSRIHLNGIDHEVKLARI